MTSLNSYAAREVGRIDRYWKSWAQLTVWQNGKIWVRFLPLCVIHSGVVQYDAIECPWIEHPDSSASRYLGIARRVCADCKEKGDERAVRPVQKTRRSAVCCIKKYHCQSSAGMRPGIS